jgi:hypothetical protein
MTIDSYIQGFQANPRFILSNQDKNTLQCVAFSVGIFPFKIEIACGNKS